MIVETLRNEDPFFHVEEIRDLLESSLEVTSYATNISSGLVFAAMHEVFCAFEASTGNVSVTFTPFVNSKNEILLFPQANIWITPQSNLANIIKNTHIDTLANLIKDKFNGLIDPNKTFIYFSKESEISPAQIVIDGENETVLINLGWEQSPLAISRGGISCEWVIRSQTTFGVSSFEDFSMVRKHAELLYRILIIIEAVNQELLERYN